jgi:hypothetical protein
VTMLHYLLKASDALAEAYKAATDAGDHETARVVRDAQRTLNVAWRRAVPDRASEVVS